MVLSVNRELFVLTLLFFLTLCILPQEIQPVPRAHMMLEASQRMQQYMEVIGTHRRVHGPPISQEHDPNSTGLIGLEFSPLTTTLGALPAKRTTTNPNLAAIFIHFFHQLGLRSGDRIGVGASSSFPAVILALWAASETYGLEVSLITSLGSSSWGANDPDFTYLDMERLLQQEGLLQGETAWVSLGGHGDMGASFWPGGLEMAQEVLRRTDYALVEGEDIQETRMFRMDYYQQRPPRLYVNIGGGGASLGSYPYNAGVSPGLNRFTPLSSAPERGLVHMFLERGVPVLHILDIQYLARKFSLTFDPQPLPIPGQGPFYYQAVYSPIRGLSLLLFTFLYLGTIMNRKKVSLDHSSIQEAVEKG